MSEKLNHTYTIFEEKLNVWSHAFGLALSGIAFPFLVLKSLDFEGFWKPASFIIYGLSLITLYAASTFYHAATIPKRRRKLNIFDHSAIYILIAGSYTPFCLVGLDSSLGYYMFLFVWLFALVGIILKLFFTGRFDKLSTAMYLLMGWQIVFVFKTLMENIAPEGLDLLISGGIFYSVGAVFYSIKKIKYNHAIFHVFVVMGSLCHFFTVFYYL